MWIGAFFYLQVIRVMQKYSDIDGDSGVVGYELGDTFIRVQFNKTFKIYTYSYSSAGIEKVERMKKLAQVGDGLNSYIKLYANNLYVKQKDEDLEREIYE